MEIGNKIKVLRRKAGITQEELGSRLNVSAQSVSKWETGTAMPDITLLPLLSREFGVSIDELFDLTHAEKLQRIENRMEQEEELPPDIFREYEEYLRNELSGGSDRAHVLSLLAHLYHHRMEADARRVSAYARESILLQPEKKDCQWLLNKAEGAAVWDWNCANHSAVIDFYKQVIAADSIEPRTPMPYYYLIDNLLADRRTQEAARYVDAVEQLPACNPVLIPAYRAHIALLECQPQQADTIMEEAVHTLPPASGILFEAAQYYAATCRYERAIELYEAAYAADEAPRFTDALQGIMTICEIMGDYDNALAACDRIVENLHTEWGYTDEAPVQQILRERSRLSEKRKK